MAPWRALRPDRTDQTRSGPWGRDRLWGLPARWGRRDRDHLSLPASLAALQVDGKEVDLYTLINKNGLIAKVTNFGAILTELDVPDCKGKLGDVVLGWDTLAEYEKNDPHLGSTVGRVGNRIANAQVRARRQDVQAGRQQRPAPPARRHQGLGQGRVGRAEPSETADGPVRSS